jgi:mono/diheme cytochrome c family protein
MRAWQWIGAAVVVVGVGVAVFMLKPVNGPARDLTLTGDPERGAYLIEVGGCVSCHTDAANGGTALAGGAALQTAFGTFFAPNITPHPEAGIGRWSLEQFASAMSDGEGPQGHLYPVFPFDHYTRLTDQDIVDLYAGLMAVLADPKVSPPHQIRFPFNMRIAVAGWKNLFFRPERFEPDPDKSAQWNRGAYLATGPAHCVACHSPRNLFGAVESGRELTGNPGGGPGGRAPAITAEALQADGYDPALLIEALRTGFTPDFDVLGGAMAEVVRDSTSQWTEEDLAALAAYLFDEG